MHDSLIVQVPRALVASVLAAVLDCALLFVFVEIGRWDRITAAIVSYLAGSVVQYVLCTYWVFPGTAQNFATGFLTFTVLSIFGLAITWLTMAVLAHVHLSVAKVIALGLAFTWNFLSRKYLLFRPIPSGA
jgi:putative flippase GtrA